MATDEENFAEYLKEFKLQYARQSALVKQHVDAVLGFLDYELKKAGVRFQSPIPSRMKTLESAIRSLERRASARIERSRLKDRLEKQDWKWEDYWREYGRDDRIDDYGRYESCDAMFQALHDIGGIRILVYFPGDVELAVKCLENMSEIKVVRKLLRGQKTSPDIMDLRRNVNILERKVDREIKSNENTFSGYRATHVHVCLADKPEPSIVIEIQIATVVMNAWSQVEHDIIYKPTKTAPTIDEVRILDTFNGVVMIGENALRQLEETIRRQEIHQANEERQFATSIYDLGQWIINHCKNSNIILLKGTTDKLSGLEYLLEVLIAVEMHTSKTVKRLIDGLLSDASSDNYAFGCLLPLDMLKQFHKISSKITNNPTFPDPSQTSWLLARFWALRVVRAVNMAIYLGIEDEFIKTVRESLLIHEVPLIIPEPRPSILDFLDALHPQRPRMNWASYDSIYKFSRAFLDTRWLKTVNKRAQSRLVELSLLLVEIGLFAEPKEADEQLSTQNRNVIVPRSLCRVLRDDTGAAWVPELCSVARNWRPLCDDLLPRRQYSKPFYSNRVSWYDLRNLWTDTQINSSSVKLHSLMNEWFSEERLQYNTRYQFTDGAWQFHVDKVFQTPSFGYFKSLFRNDNSEPSWKFINKISKNWKLSRINVESESADWGVEKFERKDKLMDLTESIFGSNNTISMCDPQDGSLSYTLTIEGDNFKLLSSKSELVLSLIPPNSTTLTEVTQAETQRKDDQEADEGSSASIMDEGQHLDVNEKKGHFDKPDRRDQTLTTGKHNKNKVHATKIE